MIKILKPADIREKVDSLPNMLLSKLNDFILSKIRIESDEYEFRLSCDDLRSIYRTDYSLLFYYSWFIKISEELKNAGWDVNFNRNDCHRFDNRWQDYIIVRHKNLV